MDYPWITRSILGMHSFFWPIHWEKPHLEEKSHNLGGNSSKATTGAFPSCASFAPGHGTRTAIWCGKNIWKPNGKPMENTWKTHGKHMDNHGKTHGILIEIVVFFMSNRRSKWWLLQANMGLSMRFFSDFVSWWRWGFLTMTGGSFPDPYKTEMDWWTKMKNDEHLDILQWWRELGSYGNIW